MDNNNNEQNLGNFIPDEYAHVLTTKLIESREKKLVTHCKYVRGVSYYLDEIEVEGHVVYQLTIYDILGNVFSGGEIDRTWGGTTVQRALQRSHDSHPAGGNFSHLLTTLEDWKDFAIDRDETREEVNALRLQFYIDQAKEQEV